MGVLKKTTRMSKCSFIERQINNVSLEQGRVGPDLPGRYVPAPISIYDIYCPGLNIVNMLDYSNRCQSHVPRCEIISHARSDCR
jgi:hypothetical protein